MTMSREIFPHPARAEQKAVDRKSVIVRLVIDYAKTVFLTLLVALVLKSFVLEAFRIPSGSMENTLIVGDFVLVDKLAYGLRLPRTIPLTSIPLHPEVFLPWGSVGRGDVVVFEYPGEVNLTNSDRQAHYVKRCMGLPGDTIRIHEGGVFVNNTEMTAPPYGKLSDRFETGDRRYGTTRGVLEGRGFTEEEFGPLVVPKRGSIIQLNVGNFDEWRRFILREGHRIHLGANEAVYVDDQPVTTYTVERDYFFMLGDNRHNSLDSRFWGFVPEENLIGEALLVYWSWDPEIPVMHAEGKMKSIRWGRIGTLIR